MSIQPIIVLPRNAMSVADMDRLRKNGVCVVEAADPVQLRFIDPPIFGASEIDQAAIEMVRRLMKRSSFFITRGNVAEHLYDIIMEGRTKATTPPPAPPTPPVPPAKKRRGRPKKTATEDAKGEA